MNKEVIIAQLEAMTLEQARREIASGKFGDPTSIVHNFASQWLMVKESEERDKRDAETLSIARSAKTIAIAAIIITAILSILTIIIQLLIIK
jgi:hypothetical protein